MRDGAPIGRGLGIALAALSALGFSTLGPFALLVYSGGFQPQQALAWRFTVAAVSLWGFLAASGRLKRARGEFRRAFLLGVFGFAPQAGLYFLTVRFLKPGIASLLLYLYPAFVILFSALFLKSKPKAFQLLSLAVALAGCALAFWEPGAYPVEGIALGVALALAYGAYLVAAQRVLEGIDPIFSTACIMLAAAIAYWIASAATGACRLPSRIEDVAGIAGLAYAASILPIVTLFASIRAVGAATASLVSTVEPVLTILISAVFLGERLGYAQLAGGALVVGAVFALSWLEWRSAKRKALAARI
jgi:drug/metabolite transporter (DMT)-like permease